MAPLRNDDKILIEALRLKRTVCINNDARISVTNMEEKHFL